VIGKTEKELDRYGVNPIVMPITSDEQSVTLYLGTVITSNQGYPL